MLCLCCPLAWLHCPLLGAAVAVRVGMDTQSVASDGTSFNVTHANTSVLSFG